MTTKHNDRNIDAASLDLDAIKARAVAATEGPWEAATCHESEQETRSEYVRNALLKPAAPAHGLWMVWKPDSRLGVHLTAVTGDGPHGEADAEFIAHAREDMPALVAEVERLRSQLTITDEMVERHRKATYSHTLSKGNANPAKTEACGCGYQNEATPEGWLDLYAHQSRAALAAALGGEQR